MGSPPTRATMVCSAPPGSGIGTTLLPDPAECYHGGMAQLVALLEGARLTIQVPGQEDPPPGACEEVSTGCGHCWHLAFLQAAQSKAAGDYKRDNNMGMPWVCQDLPFQSGPRSSLLQDPWTGSRPSQMCDRIYLPCLWQAVLVNRTTWSTSTVLQDVCQSIMARWSHR